MHLKEKKNNYNQLSGLLINTNNKEKRSKSNDSSIIILEKTHINNTNNDIISENELSGNSDNDNKLIFSRMDSCLSRLDSNIHRLDSNNSKDSNDNSSDNEQNGNSVDKFILNPATDKNFNLGYIPDKKNQNNKLSLFNSKSPFKLKLNKNSSNPISNTNRKK